MDCVVTGGAGFIGSNLVDALLARGDGVTVIDTLVTGKRDNLAGALAQGAALETVDVRDAEALRAVFEAVPPELVFHMAAQIDVPVNRITGIIIAAPTPRICKTSTTRRWVA